MMLMAHGDSQSNELQLHRPEVCFPAFGFSLTSSAPLELKIGNGVTLPARRLLAQSNSANTGCALLDAVGRIFSGRCHGTTPDRLTAAMHRYIPDGLLARFSMDETDAGARLRRLSSSFLPCSPRYANDRRGVFVGTARARLLAREREQLDLLLSSIRRTA